MLQIIKHTMHRGAGSPLVHLGLVDTAGTGGRCKPLPSQHALPDPARLLRDNRDDAEDLEETVDRWEVADRLEQVEPVEHVEPAEPVRLLGILRGKLLVSDA